MYTKNLTHALRDIAKESGYRHKGGVFWKSYDGEVTSVVQLQRSQWSGGMYVNAGVLPSVMITKEMPPDSSLWFAFRATDLKDSPYQVAFTRLEDDDIDSMDPKDMVPAMRWLFEYLDNRYSNVESVRQQTLAEIEAERPRLLAECGPAGDQGFPMVDWARGCLRSPASYAPHSKYYNPRPKRK
jgi:Domain of unknown function (DUF4304)